MRNTHDETGRMTVSNPGAEKEQTFGFDANGNHTAIHATSSPWLNQDFTYDTLNRIESATGPFGAYAFLYDKTGNRTQRTANDLIEDYAYVTGTSRLESISGDETIFYTHDTNGNTTSIGSRTLTYNQNNRLIRVEEGGLTLGEYTYNGMGQRVIKEVDGVTTVFHYDFDGNLIGESNSNGIFTTEYLYQTGKLLAKVDVPGNTVYHYMNDYLGSPKVLTDETNTAVWEATYLPFGKAVVNPGSSVENNMRFPGQYYDQETGLHYNWHRYYDPATGRYLTSDPIGLAGMDPNLYGYVGDNPINRSDPLGLAEYIVTWNEFTVVEGGGFTTVEGMVIDPTTPDKWGNYSALEFSGTLFGSGVSFPPVGLSNNVAVFEDNSPQPDLFNIEGDSFIGSSCPESKYTKITKFGNMFLKKRLFRDGLNLNLSSGFTGNIRASNSSIKITKNSYYEIINRFR